MARLDELTGLGNRRAFTEACSEWVNRDDFIVVRIDCNGLKRANDVYGHEFGDRIIKETAQNISRICRTGQAFRTGGDEFTIFWDADIEINSLAQKFSYSLNVFVEDMDYKISCAIGLAHKHLFVSLHEAVCVADEEMYRSKINSLDWSVCDDFDMSLYRIAQGLKTEFGSTRHLELHYQPIIHLTSGQITSYEALIRWNRDSGFVEPTNILAAVKKYHLSVDFALWTLRQAQQQWDTWGRPPITIAVNLSGSWLLKPAVFNAVARSQGLTIEITEDEAIEDPKILDKIDELRTLGIKISIDDFGARWSAIAQLSRLSESCDRVKIDKALLKDIRLFEGAHGLIDSLNLPTVAEGIETQDMLIAIRDAGGQFGQGYLLGRPMKGSDIGMGE
ncbi:MAG: bifunctional diguanylate cyclase/phosphodiesterase [Cyanobacteria bacterium P01_F01_bin.150]